MGIIKLNGKVEKEKIKKTFDSGLSSNVHYLKRKAVFVKCIIRKMTETRSPRVSFYKRSCFTVFKKDTSCNL